jgi:hypothetical protein
MVVWTLDNRLNFTYLHSAISEYSDYGTYLDRKSGRRCNIYGIIKIFTNTCENGHLRTAQWLFKTFQIFRSTYDLSRGLDGCFINVCWFGYLDVAQWLRKIMTPTDNDRKNWDRYACRIASARSHQNIVIWLRSCGVSDI